MSFIVASGLSKWYGSHTVFEDVDIRVEPGSRIGLVGPNGSGKTSLLRILAGEDVDFTGVVQRRKGIQIAYLPQEPPEGSHRTLREEIETAFEPLIRMESRLQRLAEAMADPDRHEEVADEYERLESEFELRGGYAYRARIEETLHGLGFGDDESSAPLSHLSGGQRTRALLAKLLLMEPDLLLLDEPTNHLDLRSLEWLESVLAQWKGAFVIVSHDRRFLDKVVDQIWELDGGKLYRYRGNYTKYRRLREERISRQQELWELQQKRIVRIEEFIRRYKAGQRSKQARGRQKLLERMMEEELVDFPRSDRRMSIRLKAKRRSGNEVLRIENMVVGYPGKPLFSVEGILLSKGEKVAIVGPNGAGKTTFLRTLTKEIEPLRGSFSTGAGVRIGYMPQADPFPDKGELSVLELLLDSRPSMSVAEARSHLARFLFTGETPFKRVDELSGGEKRRLALAVLTLRGANLLLLDEPTNHLDLSSQEELQSALAEFDGTVLFVSHDRYLIDAIASRVWVVDGGTMRVVLGGYREYLEDVAAREMRKEKKATRPDAPSRTPWEASKLARKERQRREKIRRKLESVEQEIEAVEKRIEELQGFFASASEKPPEELERMSVEYGRLEEKHEELMGRWEELLQQIGEDEHEE